MPPVSADAPRLLRANETEAEELLWAHLRNRHVAGMKFRRQHRFDPYVLDFYCAKAKLAIEVDGGIHRERKPFDTARTAFLETHGIQVLRFANAEVLTNPAAVAATIAAACAERIRTKP